MIGFEALAVAIYLALGGTPFAGLPGTEAAPAPAPAPVLVAQAQAQPQPQGEPAAPKVAPSVPLPKKKDGVVTPPAQPAPAAGEVHALVDRMQAFYEGTTDFTADFEQKYQYKGFNRTVTSSGKVAFKKPGLMRWEYEKPNQKIFLLADERAYAYDPAAMTLHKSSFDQSQLSASVTFLWGRGKLADEFDISRAECKSCTGVLLELSPKKADPRFRMIRLEVDPKTAQVLRSIVVDPDGSQNEIRFKNLTTNVGLTKDSFKLAPPPGVQVIDLTKGR